jgi:MFS family permease
LGALLVLYTAVGVLAPAGSNAANLLILEKFGSGERPSAYASFQLMSMLGAVAGLLVGYFWLLSGRSLLPLLLVLAALSAGSAVAIVVGVAEPRRTASHRQIVQHSDSLASRLRHSVPFRLFMPFFPVHPSVSVGSLRRFRAWVRQEVHHELPLILAATFLFNLSSNLFNISYTPYLYSVGVGAASIFLVNLANNGAQAVVYPASGTLTSRFGADRLVGRSTYLRSLGYLGVAGFTFLPIVAVAAFVANVVAFAVLGIAIAFYSTASSILMFRALEGRDAGRLLGFASALGGIAAVAGAALSGVLSVFGSYRLVFLVSAGALLISLPIWSAAAVAYAPRHPSASALPPPDRAPDLRAVRAAETD